MVDFYDRVIAFARTLQPDIALAYLRALREVANGYKESAVADALARGDVDAAAAIVADEAVTALALVPVKEALRDALIRSAVYFFRDTPKGPPSPTRATTMIRFQVLNPNVVRAAEAFESPLLADLTTELRAGVKATMQQQLAQGVNPRTAARSLRGLVGITENQTTYLANYRAELEALDPAALDRLLTDGRIDRTVAAAIKNERALSAEQIDRAVTAYARNLKAQTAETLTRTASINAMKEGQRLAWRQAIDGGRVDQGDLIDTWHTTLDGRERQTHHDMHGKTKRFDEPWYVPGIGYQDYPGQSEWNCRCVQFTRLRIRRASDGERTA